MKFDAKYALTGIDPSPGKISFARVTINDSCTHFDGPFSFCIAPVSGEQSICLAYLNADLRKITLSN